jgi:hypothetical protein
MKWIGSAQSLLRLTSLTSGQPFPFSGGVVLDLRGLTTTGAGIAPLHAAGDPLAAFALRDPDGAAEY